MKDGKVHEYDAPIPESYDVTKTYLIDAKLNHRTFYFTSVKSKLRVSINCVIYSFPKT